MAFVVSLFGFRPSPRADQPWTVAVIQESSDGETFADIDTQTLVPEDADPKEPIERDLTSTEATLASGYYRVLWRDADDNEELSETVHVGGPSAALTTEFYATIDDVRRALSPDMDLEDEGTAASLSDSQLQTALAEAQSEVDARIAGEEFPPGEVPDLVRDLVRDRAAYLATLTHRKGEPVDPNDPVRLRYARSEAILADIARGRIELTGEPDANAEAWVENQYEGSMFTLEDAGIGPATGGRTQWNWAWSPDDF